VAPECEGHAITSALHDRYAPTARRPKASRSATVYCDELPPSLELEASSVSWAVRMTHVAPGQEASVSPKSGQLWAHADGDGRGKAGGLRPNLVALWQRRLCN